jgi:hypothetical protein
VECTATSEGLRYMNAVVYYGRMRFTFNLLPLLQRSNGTRRVVSVYAAGREGPINWDDLAQKERSYSPSGLLAARGHTVSMQVFGLEALQQQAPDVSFVQTWPGPVRSKIAREKNWLAFFMRVIFSLFGPVICVPNEESGERHLFVGTSGRYPAKKADAKTIERLQGVEVATGTDGKKGSGVYDEDEWQGQSYQAKTEDVLEPMRKDSGVQRVWEHTLGEWRKITGV